MSPEEVIKERLENIGAVTAVVASRIYQLQLPQTPLLPALRIQAIGSVRDQHLRGPSPPFRTRVQVDSFAAERSGGDMYVSAETLAEAVLGDGLGSNASGLWGWIGDAGGSPPTVHVHNVEIAPDQVPTYEGGTLRAAKITQDYIVHWTPLS